MPVHVPRIRLPGFSRFNKALDAWREAIKRGNALTASPPLKVSDGPAGPVVRYEGPRRMTVRLTSSAGAGVYAFTQVMPSGTGWATNPDGLTGSAREFNGNATVDTSSPHYVEVTFYPTAGTTGEWRFQEGTCP